jgi:hypothetical protein
MDRSGKVRVIAAALLGAETDPYQNEAQLRALDGRIRGYVADVFARSAATLRKLYAEGHQVLGPLTRDNPLPDSQAIARLRRLKQLSEEFSSFSAVASALPAPGGDRIWRRLRNNGSLLATLVEYDYTLVELAQSIERRVQAVTADSAAELNVAELLDPIQKQLRERQDLLSRVP